MRIRLDPATPAAEAKMLLAETRMATCSSAR